MRRESVLWSGFQISCNKQAQNPGAAGEGGGGGGEQINGGADITTFR